MLATTSSVAADEPPVISRTSRVDAGTAITLQQAGVVAEGQTAELNHMAAQAAAIHPEFRHADSVTPESHDIGIFEDEWLQILYQVILGRDAEPAGLQYWASLLAAGVSRADVLRGIATSEEARGRVSQLYQDILGREAEPAGMTYWTELMASGVAFDDVRRGIATSEESRGRVNQLYRDILGRDAEPAGMTYWTNRLVAGATFLQIPFEIAKSDEAGKRMPPPPQPILRSPAPPARGSDVPNVPITPRVSADGAAVATPSFFGEPSFIYGVGILSLKDAFTKLLDREIDYKLSLRDPVTNRIIPD